MHVAESTTSSFKAREKDLYHILFYTYRHSLGKKSNSLVLYYLVHRTFCREEKHLSVENKRYLHPRTALAVVPPGRENFPGRQSQSENARKH